MTRGGIAVVGMMALVAACNLPPTACTDDQLTPSAQPTGAIQVTETQTGLDIDFGTVDIGQSELQFFSLEEGCEPVQISAVTVTGSPALSLVLGVDAGYGTPYGGDPYGEQPADAIRFTPTTTGSFSATLTFTTTSRASPTLVFTLEGTGVAPGPACATDGDCDGGGFCDGTYCEPNACGKFDDIPAWDAGPACAPESHSCPGPNGPILTNTRSDPRNCGGCGQICPAAHGCAGGRCGVCPGYLIGQEHDFPLGSQSVAGNDVGVSAFVLGDFDGDGYPDALVGADQGQNPGSAWLVINDGKGGFGAAPRMISVCGSPFAVADFNGDCALDAVAGNSVMINDGHGNFPFRTVVAPEYGANALLDVVADLNQDGYPDILGSSSLLLGDGRGGFQASAQFTPTGWAAVAVADFNGDGRPDVEGYQAQSEGTLFCYLNDGGGDLVLGAEYFVASSGALQPLMLAAGSLTGGAAAVVYGQEDALTALPDPAAGANGAAVLPLDGGSFALALTTADLDLDGRADVLAAGSGSDGGYLDLWSGFAVASAPDGGQLSASRFQTVFTRQPAAFLQVSDVNGDGIPDIVAASSAGQATSGSANASTLMVFLGSCP